MTFPAWSASAPMSSSRFGMRTLRNAWPPASRRRAALMVVSLWVAVGCKSARSLQLPAVLATKNDVARYLIEALEEKRPDARRAAIVRVAQTRHAQREAVVETLCTIARTDASPMVRCAAIRALSDHPNPTSTETLAAIAATFDRQSTIRLPDPQVRADALAALCRLARENRLEGETGRMARQAAIDLLRADESREVRIVAARYLGSCPDAESLSALIASLNQRDFGVVYQAERSLNRLTGQTFDHDPLAWDEWRVSQSDPFVAYPTTDASPSTSYSSVDNLLLK